MLKILADVRLYVRPAATLNRRSGTGGRWRSRGGHVRATCEVVM